MTNPTSTADRLDEVIAELRASARNAARRNKPTMWAYYLDMAQWLESVREKGPAATLTILRGSAAVDPDLLDEQPRFAARRWAQGVYARRILGRSAPRPRPSLDWLRRRAGIAA